MIDDLERIYDELFAETGWAEISVALVVVIATWPVAVRGAPTDALPDDHGNQIRALTEIVGCSPTGNVLVTAECATATDRYM